MALRKQLVWGCVGLVWVFLRANEAFAQPAVEPSPHPRETGGSAAELGLTSERAGGRTGGERPEHELTSEEWSPPEDQPSTLHWDLLRLPETLTRLAVSPLIPLVRGAESVRLDRRIEDIVTNDEKTRLLLPVVIIADRDGVGFGVLYRHSDLFGESEKLEVQGLVKTNLDWSVDTSYSEEIAWLNGRRLGLSLEVELDKNERYYGIGNDTFSSDERALRQEQGSAELSFEVTGPGILALKSEMTARYLRQRLGAGTDPTLDPVGQPGDRVIVPAGFDQTADYVDVSWSFAHDTRDTEGRTHRGTLLQLDLQAAHDVNGLALGAAKTTTRGALFLPLAPRHRVLVFSVGTSVVTPWTATEEIPLESLVTLGRASYLRGYSKKRFRDRVGWWGSAEYRYPIFEYRDTGIGLSSTLFVDVGRVGTTYRDAFDGNVRTSAGFGVRGEASSAFVFRSQLGFSEEGVQFTFSLNEHL